MKKIILTLFAIGILWVGWYLGSPLLIDNTVNEDFPTVQEVIEMKPEAMKMIEGMSEKNKTTLEKMVVKKMTNTMPKLISDKMPRTEPKKIASGTIKGADSFHKAKGEMSIYEIEAQKFLMRFENFEIVNGPALYVYLSKHPNPTNSEELHMGGATELRNLKGNIGNQNYDLPKGIKHYKSVVIYCKPFQVIFATAPINFISS